MKKPNLYHPVILKHAQSPCHFNIISSYTHHAEGYNPQCGDHLDIYLQVNDDHIKDVSFQGDMCALCKASASIMSTSIVGKKMGAFNALHDQFARFIDESTNEDSQLGELTVFSLLRYYPARKKCVMLPWATVKACLEGKTKASTEAVTKNQSD